MVVATSIIRVTSFSYFFAGLKKHIAKLGQIQEECDRKEKENIKKANEFKNEYMKV